MHAYSLLDLSVSPRANASFPCAFHAFYDPSNSSEFGTFRMCHLSSFSAVVLSLTSPGRASLRRALVFLYPFGASINVAKPAVPLLSTGSVAFPSNRPVYNRQTVTLHTVILSPGILSASHPSYCQSVTRYTPSHGINTPHVIPARQLSSSHQPYPVTCHTPSYVSLSNVSYHMPFVIRQQPSFS